MKKNILIVSLILVNITIPFIPINLLFATQDTPSEEVLYVTDPEKITEIKSSVSASPSQTKVLYEAQFEMATDVTQIHHLDNEQQACSESVTYNCMAYEKGINNKEVSVQKILASDGKVYSYYSPLSKLSYISSNGNAGDNFYGYSVTNEGDHYYFDSEEKLIEFNTQNISALTNKQKEENEKYLSILEIEKKTRQ